MNSKIYGYRSAPILQALMLIFVLLLAIATAPGAIAQVDTFAFESPQQQQRFRKLSNEFRCPMCQNTNLTGSTGGVAEDLRREIHRMITEGLSDTEIEQFMFERYGDFIFYRPRLRAETILLWFGPLAFLFIGGFIALGISRRARKLGEENTELDDQQQARLKELLGSKL
ncbi:MAG: cytochrome c-type biogenesis protein CcmH [Proteobacteria bacterium]|nr:cytochrome c-type biogenesis protein CcmH [Pseudomonadota bacterium]